MCGIGGYLGRPASGRDLDGAALLQALHHRGPDAQGQRSFVTRGGLPGQLLATRLAILDLSAAAHQPMPSQDGRLLLAYNGEIYNHAELRSELQQRGATFGSHSDTEVILVGYAHFGDRLWPRLRGMFALALWDAADEELRLVRDPLGQKPLYYTSDGAAELAGLCFASEVRSLLAAGAAQPQLAPQALLGYLTWGSVPEPQSLVAGVRALPPGQLLRVQVRGDRLRLLPPTSFIARERHAPPEVSSRPAAIQTLREALADTVRGHLQADVPVGLLLSGGIDSTSVAAWARAVAPEQPLWAFTLSTDAPGMTAELAQARATAQALRLRHEVLSLSLAQAAQAVPRWLAALDQPSLDGFNTFLICDQVRAAGCKVVLSGAGGDELFFGYRLHRRFAAAWAAYAHLPARLRQALPKDRYADWLYERLRRLFPPIIRRLLLRTDIYDSEHSLPPAELAPSAPDLDSPPTAASSSAFVAGLARVQACERRRYLCHTLLRDGDVLSMAHGVELRLPLCDPWLWRVVSALAPWSYADHKALLVAAAPPKDPRVQAVAAQPKRGFELPLDDWLRGPLSGPLQALLLNGDQVAAAGLQPRAVRGLWQLHRAAMPTPLAVRRRLAHRIWALYVWLAYVQRHALYLDTRL